MGYSKGFIIYQTLMDSAKDLDSNEFKDLFVQMFDYSVKGVEPTFDGMKRVIFNFYRPTIDNNNDKYNAKVAETLNEKKQ